MCRCYGVMISYVFIWFRSKYKRLYFIYWFIIL